MASRGIRLWQVQSRKPKCEKLRLEPDHSGFTSERCSSSKCRYSQSLMQRARKIVLKLLTFRYSGVSFHCSEKDRAAVAKNKRSDCSG